jgi:indolepyruvate ferredoxin oxidoreductase
MTWPLEPEGARRFAEGLQEVIVIEEKRSNLEEQLVHLLYNMPAGRRPLVIGKSDETGASSCRAKASSRRPASPW